MILARLSLMFAKNLKFHGLEQSGMGVNTLPLKCPVCGLPFKSLGRLAQHVFQLADWYIRRPSGKGVGSRVRHYRWLKERNITMRYESVKRYLEGLLRQGLIKRV